MSQEILKVLAQGRPTVEEVLYTVPTGRRGVVSRFLVVNNTAGSLNATVSIVPGGSNDIVGIPTDDVNTIVNLVPIPAFSELPVNLDKLTLDEFDDIRIASSSIGIVFHIYGEEVVPEKT